MLLALNPAASAVAAVSVWAAPFCCADDDLSAHQKLVCCVCAPRLLDVVGNNTPLQDAFLLADDVLRQVRCSVSRFTTELARMWVCYVDSAEKYHLRRVLRPYPA